MLSAVYNTPASAWTQAIDDALSDWSRYVVGDTTLKFNISFDEEMSDLARATTHPVLVGTADGVAVYILQTQASLQGKIGAGTDVYITVNPTFDWSFSGEAGKYDAQSVMTHEVGHALFMLGVNGGETPFELWRNSNASDIDASGLHTVVQGLMYPFAHLGSVQRVSSAIAKIAGQSGTPTVYDDRIYLTAGAHLDAGPGVDTAVWLSSASSFDAELKNVEFLEFPSVDQLTDRQLSIWGLYEGLLNRSPDLGGFQYWDNSSLPLDHIAGGIRHSAEFQNTHVEPLVLTL